MGLEMVEIVLEVERKFDVTISQRQISDCSTYGDLLNLVVNVLAASESNKSTSDIDNYLRNVLISEYRIKAEHITIDAELYGPELNLG